MKIVYIVIFMIAAAIAGISGSSYGLGLSHKNRASTEYTISTIFLVISLIICIGSISSLIVIISPQLLENVASSIEPVQQAYIPPVESIPVPGYANFVPTQQQLQQLQQLPQQLQGAATRIWS